MVRNYVLKLEKIFFYFFLFSLPFQTRLILREWGREFNEWNSAFLYFTDLLILSLLFFWALRKIFRVNEQQPAVNERKNCSLFIVLCLFFVTSALSLIIAQNLGLGIYQLIKLAEFIFLFFYIKNNLQKLFSKIRVSQVFIVSGLFQVAVAIFQFASQKSLGLKLLAESPLGPNIEGVAKIVVSGVKMIRAYGTFPHPNVLAAFLLFAIFCFYFLYLKLEKPSFGLKLASMSIFTLLTFGLFLTFSRLPIFLFFIFSIFLFLYLFFKRELYYLCRQRTFILGSFFLFAVILCGTLMAPLLYSRFVVGAVDPGINLRFFYNFISLEALKESPFLGQGLGNFVWGLQDFQGTLRAANLIYKLDVPETEVVPYLAPSWLFQPVHNIYLLIAVETGILGLLFFLIFLGLIFYPIFGILKKDNLLCIFYFLFSIFLLIFLADHFFWTLQQGRLMFWILAGILASKVDR